MLRTVVRRRSPIDTEKNRASHRPGGRRPRVREAQYQVLTVSSTRAKPIGSGLLPISPRTVRSQGSKSPRSGVLAADSTVEILSTTFGSPNQKWTDCDFVVCVVCAGDGISHEESRQNLAMGAGTSTPEKRRVGTVWDFWVVLWDVRLSSADRKASASLTERN